MVVDYAALVEEALPEAAPALIDRLATWIAEVAAWNRRLRVTSARDDRELTDLMVADAAELARAVSVGLAVVDVGSGVGAPGLALALLRGDLAVTLVEPMQRRAALLRLVLGKLARAGAAPVAAVLQQRGEQVERRFDAAVSRATLPPPRWLALGARLAPRGQVWVLLARERAPSLDGWRTTADRTYRWPLTGAARRLVCLSPDPSRRAGA